MATRNHRENCGICHAITCEHTRAARAIQEAVNQLNQPALGSPPPDPRDAEIARLKAEVDFLRSRERDICAAVGGVSDGGRFRNDVSEHLKMIYADLAAHKRALAAGPAALRAVALQARAAGETPLADGALDCAAMVEAAQEAAMKEGT